MLGELLVRLGEVAAVAVDDRMPVERGKVQVTSVEEIGVWLNEEIKSQKCDDLLGLSFNAKKKDNQASLMGGCRVVRTLLRQE